MSSHFLNASHCSFNLIFVQGPSSTALHPLLSREVAKFRRWERRQRMEAEKRYYRDLKDALPESSNEEVTRPTLLNRGGSFSTRKFNNQAFNFCFCAVHDLATQHILDLEERNKELKARIAKKEAEIQEILALPAAYRDLKDALPDCSNQEATWPTLLNQGGSYSTRKINHQALNFYFHAMYDLATQHILDLEERNKELKARIMEEERKVASARLQRLWSGPYPDKKISLSRYPFLLSRLKRTKVLRPNRLSGQEDR